MQKAPKFRAAKLAAQLRNFYLSATYPEKPPFALRHIVRRFARNFLKLITQNLHVHKGYNRQPPSPLTSAYAKKAAYPAREKTAS